MFLSTVYVKPLGGHTAEIAGNNEPVLVERFEVLDED